MAQRLYVLILAGGSGERFWPLSRRHKPKQLLSLFSDNTLLEDTLDRLDGLVPPEQILILTNQDQEEGVRKIAKKLPAENIVAEPAKRDTAAAIALGVAWIALRDRSATMAVLPADHLIQNKAGFQKTLQTAALAAQQTGELVTIGIKPTWPCPGFGYIEVGEAATVSGAPKGSPAVHEVRRFREKPNPELAETFLKQGGFWWNAGMFLWTLPAILSSLERFAPSLASFVNTIREKSDLEGVVKKQFSKLPKISIDYAVMEKAPRVLMVEAGFDWDDVGSWTAVAKYLQQDSGKNSSNTELTAVRSDNNIVYSAAKQRVALLGVHNLIVVQTADALLICDKGQAERIKDLVATVPKELQ